MDDFFILSRRAGKSEMLRHSVDFALSRGKKIAVATNNQAHMSADLIARTDADLCEISGDIFVIPHKRKRN
jgi:collagenase-like PrtC family protease